MPDPNKSEEKRAVSIERKTKAKDGIDRIDIVTDSKEYARHVKALASFIEDVEQFRGMKINPEKVQLLCLAYGVRDKLIEVLRG